MSFEDAAATGIKSPAAISVTPIDISGIQDRRDLSLVGAIKSTDEKRALNNEDIKKAESLKDFCTIGNNDETEELDKTLPPVPPLDLDLENNIDKLNGFRLADKKISFQLKAVYDLLRFDRTLTASIKDMETTLAAPKVKTNETA